MTGQRTGTFLCVMHASKLLFREVDQLMSLEQGFEDIHIFKSLSAPGTIRYTFLCIINRPKVSFFICILKFNT